MVQYSFKSGFLADIRSKVKRQTIRLPRKRHARAGEALQLKTGPRMRPIAIGTAVCRAVHEVRLDFDINTVSIDDAIIFGDQESLDRFAIRDGFTPQASAAANGLTPWEYMRRWWRVTHPDHDVFAGVLIDWEDTFEAAV